ncbi:lipopolysaccharide biosynthesis protein [Chryseobacterium sp. TY3]
MSQLKKGAILSYITIFLTNIVGLVLTPFIIRSLGNSEYGLYTLIGALVAQISILNLGLNNTVIRYVAKYRAEKKKEEESNFLGSIMLIYVGISILVLLIGAMLYLNINSIFKSSLTIQEIEGAKPMLILLICNLAITLPGGTFEAICNAYERFVFPRFLNIIKYISRALLIVVVLAQYQYAITIIWIDTLLNLAIVGTTIFYVFNVLKVKFKLDKLDLGLIKDIFSYSIWIFLFAIAYRLQWYSGQTILGITTDTITVAIFGVGVMLGGYYGAFAGAINTVLLPKATKMSVSNDDPKLYTQEMIKIGRINVLILYMILGGFILFGISFIKLWVGKTYQDAWFIAVLIMISMTLPLVQAFGNSILEAKKKNRFKSILSLITLTISVALGFFLSKKYGMYGMIIPLVIAMFINSIITTWYYRKVFGLNIYQFFKEVFVMPTLLLAILLIIGSFILQNFQLDSWLLLSCGVVLFVLIYLALSYFFVLDKSTKAIIFRLKS